MTAVMEPLIRYQRGTPGNTRGDDSRVLGAVEILLAEHADLLRKDRRRLAGHRATAAFRASRLGLRAKARTHAFGAVAAQPTSLRHWARAAFVLAPVGPRRWRSRATTR
jgi:hypothetical protein